MQQAKFIEVSAGARYWDDSTLNGQADSEGKMPLRSGDYWTPVIELDTGRIVDWPQGTVASIHYKVCDDGDYWLLNAERQRIAKWKGHYVPGRILCRDGSNMGDYIVFKIGADGVVVDWTKPELNAEQWETV